MTDQILTFEQINRIYARCRDWAAGEGYPLYAWYRGACEFVTGMHERRPAEQSAVTAFELGRQGSIPEALARRAGSAALVPSGELLGA